MSLCTYPVMEEARHKHFSREFLKGTPDIESWNLLVLQDMAKCGNDLATISTVVPFRSEECTRSRRCCGVCTRKCYTRCLQDCLHRLYLWRKLVETTPAEEQSRIPLGIRMIVLKKFEEPRDLSYAVGEIISQSSNMYVKEYMKNANLRPEENPYKIDYGPQVAIDPSTGKRIVNPNTGFLQFLDWPVTGLCPYCLPNNTIDRRFRKSSD